MNKIPNEIDLTTERMKEAWLAQRNEPKSENRLPKFDPNTDKTDWVVCAFYVGKHEATPKKGKKAPAEPKQPKEPAKLKIIHPIGGQVGEVKA